MKCPRCVQRIHRAADSCPHCGFSIRDADAIFGGNALGRRRLTDRAGILRRGERAQVEAAMARLSRHLPQVFVAVHTGAMGEVATLRQFGFWLLNRATFEDVPDGLTNDAGIVFIIDPESKTAGMAFGYLLDPYLEEADTFECLVRGHAHWLEQRYAEGLVKAIAQLQAILGKRSRQARRNPEFFQRKVLPPAILGAAMRQARDHPPTTGDPAAETSEVRP